MRFNVRSALSAVSQLAEGTLAGQIEAQQEQQQRAAAEFQRSLALTQLDTGAANDLTSNSFNALRYADPSAVGAPISALLKGQAAQGKPSDTVIGGLSPQSQGYLHLHPSPNGQPQPVGGSSVTGFPASGDENGGSPGLTPGATTTQSSGMAQQPWATPANTQAPPPPAQPVSHITPGFLHQVSPFAPGMQQTIAAMGPFGPLLKQAMNPPAPTQPVGVPPPALTGPGDVGGAAAPQQQPVTLQGFQQPAQPMPAPETPPQGIIFPQDPGHEVPVAGTKDPELRAIFNEMNKVAGELAKVDLKDNPNAAQIVSALRALPGYDSGHTAEGRALMQQVTGTMRGLLAGAQRIGTPGQEAGRLRAQTGDKKANRQALQKAFEGMDPAASMADINKTIADYGLTDDFKDIQDLRGRVFGKRIADEMTKIQGQLVNASHMSPGELQGLIGRLNGLKGYRPGSLKIPYSEYRKLSIQDRAALVARTQVSVDTHLAREDTHRLAPLIRERAQAGIDLAQAHIKDLEQRARQRGDRAGLSAAAELRAYSHREDQAAREVQQYVKNPDHAGVEEDTMDFIDAKFGPWLHANNPTLPNSSWEKELKSGKDQTDAGQKMAATPNIYIGYIRGVLKLHSLEVMRSAKQDELTKKFGGVPDQLSAAPAAATGGSTIDLSWLRPDWNTSLVQKSMSWYLSNGKSEAAARQHIREHPELFGPGTR